MFDLDGTIADTAPDLGAALNRIRRDSDLDELPLGELRPHASHGVRGLLAAGMGMAQDHPRYPELADRFLSYYEDALCVQTALFEGVERLLDVLDATGRPWGIVTNKRQRFTAPLIDALGLTRRSACVVSGDSAPHPKPRPEPLWFASRLVGAAPERCIYVGDDLRDVRAARSAGMKAVAAAYGYLGSDEPIELWGADRIIASPEELLDWVAPNS